MWTRVEQIRAALTADERSSLKKLRRHPSGRTIPFRHAGRFLNLGLAELSMGQLALTIPGRQILGLIAAE